MTLERRSLPFPHWLFTAAEGGDQLRVVPERGGLITGWRCGGREMLYLDEQRFLDPSLSVRGGIPVLFPICGGLPGNVLPLDGETFPLPQHGFARDQEWDLRELEDRSGVCLVLRDNEVTRRMFPFPFQLRLDVRLAPSRLDLELGVLNQGTTVMPFSLGLHPYFNVSGLQSVRFEGLPDRCLNQVSMELEATGDRLQRLADGVDLLMRPGEATPPGHAVGLIDENAGLHLELALTPPLDLVVIWTDPPRSMVCLEPWTAPRNSLISGDRRLELQPGEAASLRCRYAVRAQA
jgi:galactose mutarotase-like enzyme